jgi:SH3 domain-containing YSC84-like protein 1
MKKISISLLCFGVALSALGLDKAELDQRLQRLTSKLEAMQQKTDKQIPAESLRKARGVILLDRTKAGFIFAYQGGSGVALVKGAKEDEWSPAAFLTANEASLGFQIGGQQSFVVILLMTTNATHALSEAKIDFGGEASGTAGDASAAASGTVSSREEPILVYDDRKGLYGGAAIKGGSIAADENANRIYYDQYVSIDDILFQKKVKPSEAAIKVANKLNSFCKEQKK